MKNTKRRFPFFSFYDRTGIENYLEKQAQNGWLLDKTSAGGWHFHRIEPRKLHFSVVYFAKASAFDPKPSEEQLTFQDLCEHTGWKLAASNAQMQIFYNDAANPIPIETDASLEVSAIHASAKKSHLPTYWLFSFTGVLQMLLFVIRLIIDPLRILTSNASLFTGFCWMFMLIMSVTELVHYYRWHKRAQKAAETDGSFVETKGCQNFQLIVPTLMLMAIAFLLISYGSSRFTLIAFTTIAIIVGVTAILVGISELMKKFGLSAKANRNITFLLTLIFSFGFAGVLVLAIAIKINTAFPEKVPVTTYEYKGWTHEIYHDKLPLTVEDLVETDYDNYSYEIRTQDKSFLAEQLVASQQPCLDALSQPQLDYTITTIKAPLFYNWCKKAALQNFAHNYGRPVPEDDSWEEHVKVDAAPWNAKEAYQLWLGGDPEMRFLLCYETRIVEVDWDYDSELTEEHKKIIGQKLGFE